MGSKTYTTLNDGDELAVELPNGIGCVTIRTGNVQGQTGAPVISVQVANDVEEEPALDGRTYHTVFSPTNDTVYLRASARLHPAATSSCGCGGKGRHGIDHPEE